MSRKESKRPYNSIPVTATRHGWRHETAPSLSYAATRSATRPDLRHATAPSSSYAATRSATQPDLRHTTAPSSRHAATVSATWPDLSRATAPRSSYAATRSATRPDLRHATAPSSSYAATRSATQPDLRHATAPSSNYVFTAPVTRHGYRHVTGSSSSYASTTSTTRPDSRQATAPSLSNILELVDRFGLARFGQGIPQSYAFPAPAPWHDYSRHAAAPPGFSPSYESPPKPTWFDSGVSPRYESHVSEKRPYSRYTTTHPGFFPSYASSAGNNLQQPEAQARMQGKYSRIGDDYRSMTHQVAEALKQAGIESLNLIIGIDFARSNKWTGENSYNRRCLHDIGTIPNPYEQAISIIGRTLWDSDEDNFIPCFGFGDASTHDKEVFSFYPENHPCNGFEDVLERYREIVPTLRLSGPTSFAPIIETAIGIVDNTCGQYHVLLIISHGQVARGVDTQSGSGQLSPQERDTIDAIVKASYFPLSIILVGVGDGPWDMMHTFDDNIPARLFHNFQFVNFTDIMSKSIPADRKDDEFALSALPEILTQYRAINDLQTLGHRQGISPRVPLRPPWTPDSRSSSIGEQTPAFQQAGSFRQPQPAGTSRPDTYASESSQPEATWIDAYAESSSFGGNYERSLEERLSCTICMDKPKDLAFGCGHQTCCDCGKQLVRCPMCQQNITIRIRLY